MKKILIIRFSSIGDIVLTTPIIRCAKKQYPGAEIHFATKEIFKNVIVANPYLSRVHTFRESVTELYRQLKAEKFDVVIDLHHNLRSLRLKTALGVKSYAFNKINFEKFIAVRFKVLGILPHKHIVDRFFEAVAPLDIKSDKLGLDYFIPEGEKITREELFPGGKFIALVVGGSYHTKKIPLVKLIEICAKATLPVILLGGKEDREVSAALNKQFPLVVDGCGRYSINQSASIVSQAQWVITSDTGLMHIAAAFNRKIISVWGNTIPDFGMSPYKPQPENLTLEIHHLKCRPCSKLGYKKCPRGHFRCMLDIDYEFVSGLQ